MLRRGLTAALVRMAALGEHPASRWVRFHLGRHSATDLRLKAALRPRHSVPTVQLGTQYGGTSVPLQLLTSESIVYSGGVGDDVSFDLALIDRVGCDVWAFDPTPGAITFAADLDEPRFHFYPYGLWSTDTMLPFFVPADERYISHSLVDLAGTNRSINVECRSIPSIMRELGHDRIDLLKLDVEGAEYEVLGSLVDIRPRIVCVELHRSVSVSTMISFVRALPYDPIRVDSREVTLLARSR